MTSSLSLLLIPLYAKFLRNSLGFISLSYIGSKSGVYSKVTLQELLIYFILFLTTSSVISSNSFLSNKYLPLNVLSSNYLYNELEKNINDVSIESVDVYAEESVINNFKNKFKNVIVEKINEKY